MKISILLLALSFPLYAQVPIAGNGINWIDYVAVKGFSGSAGSHNGDTSMYTAWGPNASGSLTYNGATINGVILGTKNDGNLNDGTTTCGSAVMVTQLTVLDWNTPSNTFEKNRNCMTSYGGPSSLVWSPAANGTCTTPSGTGTDCDWKSRAPFYVNGNLYMFVHRQAQVGGSFQGFDATLIKSTDNGLTWCNPAHCGSSTNSNGDAPAGPGDATYPSSIIWPAPGGASNGNKIGRVIPIIMCQDMSVNCPTGSTVAGCDPATYLCALVEDGSFNKKYLLRWVLTDLPNLSTLATNTQYYQGGDGTQNSAWVAGTTGLSTIFTLPVNTTFNQPMGTLCMMSYVQAFGSYLMTCAGNNPTGTQISYGWSSTPWGNFAMYYWENIGTVAFSSSGAFPSPILATMATTATSPLTVQASMVVTQYNQNASGTTGFGLLNLQVGRAPTNASAGTTTLGYSRTRAMNAHARYAIPRKGLAVLFDFFDNKGSTTWKNFYVNELTGNMGYLGYCVGFSNGTYNSSNNLSWTAQGYTNINGGTTVNGTPGCDTSGTLSGTLAFNMPTNLLTAGHPYTAVYVIQEYNTGHNFQTALGAGLVSMRLGFQNTTLASQTCFTELSGTFTSNSPCTTTGLLVNNQWYMKALTYSGGNLSGTTIRFWSIANSGTITQDTQTLGSYTGIQNQVQPRHGIQIGSNTVSDPNPFWGTYAYIAIYDRELTTGEMLQILRAVKPALTRRGITLQ